MDVFIVAALILSAFAIGSFIGYQLGIQNGHERGYRLGSANSQHPVYAMRRSPTPTEAQQRGMDALEDWEQPKPTDLKGD